MEERVPEQGTQDPSRDTTENRPPIQVLEKNPWDTIDTQPATSSPEVAPLNTPNNVPPAFLTPGERVGGPPPVGAKGHEPPQTPPPADRLPVSPIQVTPTGSDNNPFLKKLAHEREASGHSSSPPTGSFGQMSLNEPSTNPSGPAASHNEGPGSGANPWSMGPPPQPKTQPAPAQPPSSVPGGDEELLIWADQPSDADVNDWHRGMDSSTEKTRDAGLKEGSSAPEVVPSIRQDETPEGWNLIDHEPRQEAPLPAQQETSAENTAAPPGDQPAPSLPPRITGRGATEVYHILHIKWQDPTARENPRTSPILVQNANGPCPLVALVNALVLTTPADAADAPLVHTLQSREQISIDLLLQAVVEELTASPRRPSDAVLPDLTELFNFLKGLDTGMNANPRFVPSEERPGFLSSWLAHLDPSERDTYIPGGFEQTKEMELYSTFSIPLIHGWLPDPSDVVYGSMERRAQSYEEAQHILFQEEELEAKLENPESGLTPEEQEIYQDILIIKDFLHNSATQLTTMGLEVLRKAVPPGAVAILFRNDHFSTIYKHPETHVLCMLVSDSEFAGHEGTVWEAFNDVTGRSEFLSGDFRPVRVAHSRDRSSSAHLSAGALSGRHEASPRAPSHEQEDQDYAMALQLQEEEEERHRQEQQARRQRERRFSEQYIDQQGRHPPQPAIRMSSAGLRRPGQTAATSSRAQQVRPLVPPPRGAREGADEAPPSYDESANDAPFRPPVGHPSHPDSIPGGAPSPSPYQDAQGTAAIGLAASAHNGPNQRPIRRPVARSSERPRVASGSGSSNDCTVM